MTRFQGSKLIFIDESGTHLGMARTHGRVLGGERLRMPIPLNKGIRLSMIGALGLTEFKSALLGQWSTDGEIFLGFIQEQVVPQLATGDIVIMDNLSAHKVAGVKEAIESVGASLLYLPPYSPDFSPIENAWSKMKAYLRKKAARTLEDLTTAICEAFQQITPSDIAGWFKHCGYCIQSSEKPL